VKIAYIIHSLHLSGGMERVLTLKANCLAEKYGCAVSVITSDMGSRKPFFPLSPLVEHIDLGASDNYGKVLSSRYASRLKDALRRISPDVSVAVSERDAFFLEEMEGVGAKVAELHFSHDKYSIKYGGNPLGNLYAGVRTSRLEKVYSKMDAVVLLTKRDLSEWQKHDGNFFQIYNPLTFSSDEVSPLTAKRAIAVGRLEEQKNFMDLILAWRLVKKGHPDWKLDIFGEGSQRGQLEKVIRSEGLGDVVTLKGTSSDIPGEMLTSSLLVMSSLYEGFPMVLLEGAECGLPMVSYDCMTGPSEIISDGINGYLVPVGDWQGLGKAICKAVENPDIASLGRESKSKAGEFSMESIMGKWMDLFTTLSSRKN